MGSTARIDVPLVQLLGGQSEHPADDQRTYAELATPAGLAAIALRRRSGPPKDCSCRATPPVPR